MSSPTAAADPRSGRTPELQFILKVASRCNLACDYCYVYSKGDESWRAQPRFMQRDVLAATVERIRRHCQRSGQESVRVTFHGGEPCLAGTARFDHWCGLLREGIGDVCPVELSLQTNGVLLDGAWVDVLRRHGVGVGLSIDGPADIHDASRVDHAGRGSHAAVERGLRLLLDADVPVQVLCVVQPGRDGLRVHRYLVDAGARRINYLLPDHTHDSAGQVRAVHGPAPCADYLLPVLEHWWRHDSGVHVSMFWNLARLVLGGQAQVDLFGGTSYQYAFVEADGSIEGLDVLRICGEGLSGTGLNVLRDDFTRIAEVSALHRQIMFDVVPTPAGCAGCPEETTCAGGYLPHRYSRESGLTQRSVWCEDLLRLFGRMRELLDVPASETLLRREALDWLHARGPVMA